MATQFATSDIRARGQEATIEETPMDLGQQAGILGRFPTRQESQPDQRGRQVIVRRELRQISQIPVTGAVRSERLPGHR